MKKNVGKNLFLIGLAWVSIVAMVTLICNSSLMPENHSGQTESYLWLAGALAGLAGCAVLFWLNFKAIRQCNSELTSAHESKSRLFQQLKSGMSQLGTASMDVHPVPEASELEQSLLELHTRLTAEAEKDKTLKWSIEGEAKFGELFRSAATLKELSTAFIGQLVKYLHMNQGAIYIHESHQGEDQLVMLGCYAYDRQKHLSATIQPGEGQVGQCYLERETIILKKVPGDYIHITSGLGEARPDFVLLVPVKTEDEVEGIVELAGFKAMENHQIHFVENICQALASVIRNLRIDDTTRRLLEESQQQSEQLKAQEEEIRQNMEEMQATQEQLNRQLEESRILQEEAMQREQVMALTTILSETDIFGTITFVNSKFCEVSKFTREDVLGRPHNVVRHPDMPKELFKLLWSTIKQGKVFQGIVKNRTKDNSHYWVEATIVPVRNAEGVIVKYVGSRYHIQDDYLAEQLYNQQADRLGLPHIGVHQPAMAANY